MKWITILLLSGGLAFGQEAGLDDLEAKQGEVPGEEMKEFEKYDAGLVIAKPIAALKAPRFWEGVGDVGLTVFSKNENVQKHVNHGFALLHASWDFEAYRHFAEALKEDPNCLMAYCGVVLALTNPEHEFKEERARAVNRMLSLAEEKGSKEGTFYFPDLERGYAFSLGILLTDGVVEGASAFRKVARRYPKDIQLTLLAAFLSRGGYSEFGDVRPAQASALRVVKGLLKEFPDNAFVMNFLVMMQAEAPYQAADFKGELLGYSKKLVELSGGKMPTWHALLGHMAWRCGDLELAEASFTRAIELYTSWQEEDGVANADADGLVKAKIFLAAVKYAKDDLEAGVAILNEVNGWELGADRKLSSVAVTLRWQGNLLPFHLYLARGAEGDLEKAKNLLPQMIGKREKVDGFRMVLDGYSLLLRVMDQVKNGKVMEAKRTHAVYGQLLEEMKEARGEIMKTRQYTDYMRHYRALFTHHLEMTGILSGRSELAYNWFKSAADSQRPGSRLLPNPILYPMELRLAQYFIGKDNPEEALRFAKEGAARMPYCPRSRALVEKLEK